MHGIKKKNRLGKETSRVIEKGKRKRYKNIVLYYLKDENPRMTAVAGRKVGKSSRRNKLKRWAREIFRKERQRIGDYSMVIIYKQGAGEYNYNQVRDILFEIFKGASII